MDAIRNERLSRAVEAAAASGDARPLMEVTSAVLSAADPRHRVETARAVGAALAAQRGRVPEVLRALASVDTGFWFPAFAAAGYAARAIAGSDARGADEAMQLLAERDADVREAVIDGLRARLDADEAKTLAALAAWTDGFLQAHVALSALAEKTRLAHMPEALADALVARLDEAFRLADDAPRSADRSQGLRTLRGYFPAQIALFAARFPREVLAWLDGWLVAKRPETRDAVSETIAALKKASMSTAATGRLRAALDASAPPPRDPSRIIKGMRGRGKNRG